MYRTRRRCEVCLILVAALAFATIGHTQDWQPVAVTETLGLEIDAAERSAYSLFPDQSGFISARFLKKDDTHYRVEITRSGPDGKPRTSSRGVSAAVWDLAVAHANVVEEYQSQTRAASTTSDAESQYRIALHYGSRARYDIARTLMNDLSADYPGSAEASRAEIQGPVFDRLANARRAPFLPGSLSDKSGHTDLLVFAGYYGLWAGVALPVYFEADGAEAYAAGLLLGAPAAIFLAHSLTKNKDISRGNASIISLGGHLGTWQGIGWTALNDVEGNEAVGAGLLGGLAGIGGAALLTHAVSFSEGHGALTSAALPWGVWVGIAGAMIADEDDGDGILRTALIASDVLVLGTGIAARNVRMSQARVRLISLAGVAGTAAGFGIALLTGGDDLSAEAGFGASAGGSVAGIIAGGMLTRNYDRGRDLAQFTPTSIPEPWIPTASLGMAANPFNPGEMMPRATIAVSW